MSSSLIIKMLVVSFFACAHGLSLKVNRHNASIAASSEDALCWCQQASRGAGVGTLANGWGTFKKGAFAVKDASGQQCAKANKKCSECYYRSNPCCNSKEDGG